MKIHALALASFAGRVEAAVQAEPAWPAQVAAGVGAALGLAAESPLEVQVLLGDPFAAGPHGGYAHEQLVSRFAPALAPGRVAACTPLPRSLEPYLIGSVVSIVGERIRAGEAESLPALAASLAEFVLIPYVGAGEARRVARDAQAD